MGHILIRKLFEKISNYKTLTLTVEKSALLNFYNSSNGHEWNKSTNWGSNEIPVSDWYGIETHKETGLVKSIRLSENNLVAVLDTLVPHIKALRTLEELWYYNSCSTRQVFPRNRCLRNAQKCLWRKR